MAAMKVKSRRAFQWVAAAAGLLIWLVNAYRLVVGLRQMNVPDAVCAGMIFLFGPLLILESLRNSS
jgi:hypothetical protein